MEEVETAAADTTSEASSPPHPLPPLIGAESFEPSPKRRKAEPVQSTPGLQGFREAGLQSLESRDGVHHYSRSGRIIPVGIAQPIQMAESSCGAGDLDTLELKESPQKKSRSAPELKSSARDTSRQKQASSEMRSYGNKHLSQAFSGDDNLDSCDSDQSLSHKQRFDRFENENSAALVTRTLPDKRHRSDSLSSDTSSDSHSSSSDEFPYAPPLEGDGIETGQSRMELRQCAGTLEEQQQRRSGDELDVPRMPEIPRKPSLVMATSASLEIPSGKKWHVFISHSTGDRQWARESLILPLRSPPHNLQVCACYHFMPDDSRYNDKSIHSTIRESCIVVVGLSPAYLNSQRCAKEWQLAVQLYQETCECQLVVAAVGVCSRPEPLKNFLYLDFMDPSKHGNVWGKLLETIDSTVKRLMPPPLSPGYEEDSPPSGSMDQQAAGMGGGAVYRDKNSSSSSNNSDNDNGESNFPPYDESYQQISRMADEFEEDFKQFVPEADFDGKQMGGSGESDAAPSDPRLIDISAAQGLVTQQCHGSEGEEEEEEEEEEEFKGHERPEEREGGSNGAEEGELSDSSSDQRSAVTEGGQSVAQSEMVASFYNRLARPEADKRNESPIFHMRNFNNWVKSVLIRTYLPPSATVLDLCCGKGGDLLKWKEGGIEYLACADISETSIEHAKGRYHSTKMLDRQTGSPPYEAEFIVADLCESFMAPDGITYLPAYTKSSLILSLIKVRLRDKYKNAARRFHLSSCQFSLHYSFESYERAHMMIRNACENLRPGGYFIGTTIDSNELVHRLREAGRGEDGTWSIGNDVFSVTLDSELNPFEKLPLFGAKYYFKLHGVVDLPEFLVHLPLLVSMLRDFDMDLCLQQNFYDFFMERRHKPDDLHLMFKMQAFGKQTGTMTAAPWETIGLYLVYVFQKRDPALMC